MSGDLESIIVGEVKSVVENKAFDDWWKGLDSPRGGLVIINNSFEFRDVETKKANDYLALHVDDSGSLNLPPVIASGIRINSDFKYFSPKSGRPPTRSLSEAVAESVQNLGELLFILIGQISDTRKLSETVNHSDFETVVWDPEQIVRVEDGIIVVGQVHDEDSVWESVQKHYESLGEPLPGGLREAVGVALDKLQQAAVADVKIPDAHELGGEGITDQIVAVLKEQMAQYEQAVERATKSSVDTAAQNEILRLAYNFASDATGYLTLIVSVCDLKSIVLWGTVSHHLSLSEAFKILPWTRSKIKASMKNYVSTISDARNSAFHNLFPFRKSLNVLLSGEALAGAELLIFSEHSRKRENVLSYKDKPLVDVLTGFTRARERRVTVRFWRQNLKVMEEALKLFEATSSFVKKLRSL